MPESNPETTVHESITLRLIEALEASARCSAEVAGRQKGLEKEFAAFRDTQARDARDLRDTVERQIGEFEEEMKSTNSHLDNLVRETVATNRLLQEASEDQKAAQKHQEDTEKEEREWRRKIEERRLDRHDEIEDDTRNTTKKYADELWAVFKQPLGYLVAGVIFWVVINWFAVPPQLAGIPLPPSPQVEVAPVP